MTSERGFDLSRFNSPGEFRRVVPTAGTPFCLATQKIMGKYGLTFAKACEFLEEKGYLFWAGTIPIYDLAGDKLWLDKKE